MLIIGHRGACGYAPENTLASIKKAIELKVEVIEFDVHMTKDNILVAIHDDSIGENKISEMNYDETQDLDVGNVTVENGVQEDFVTVLTQDDLKVFTKANPRPANAIMGDEAIIAYLDLDK